jgi:hypothetical protein
VRPDPPSPRSARTGRGDELRPSALIGNIGNAIGNNSNHISHHIANNAGHIATFAAASAVMRGQRDGHKHRRFAEAL